MAGNAEGLPPIAEACALPPATRRRSAPHSVTTSKPPSAPTPPCAGAWSSPPPTTQAFPSTPSRWACTSTARSSCSAACARSASSPREDGERLQPHLKPGQRLVSLDGDLWRWDGFSAAAHGATPAAQRIAERNRLVELRRLETRATEEADILSDAEAHAAEQMQTAEGSRAPAAPALARDPGQALRHPRRADQDRARRPRDRKQARRPQRGQGARRRRSDRRAWPP